MSNVTNKLSLLWFYVRNLKNKSLLDLNVRENFPNSIIYLRRWMSPFSYRSQHKYYSSPSFAYFNFDFSSSASFPDYKVNTIRCCSNHGYRLRWLAHLGYTTATRQYPTLLWMYHIHKYSSYMYVHTKG